MSTRGDILQATADLIAESETGEVSTRAICERAGVQAPTIYRHFGDKDGLVAAVVDHAFEQYLGSKREVEPTDDPVVRVRNGWDSHNAWGLANPAYYRIIFSPFARHSVSANEAMQILRDHLELCAAAGLLRISPAVAAQMIMSANVGVTLMSITRAELYPDPELSTRVRDSIHAQIFVSHDSAAISGQADVSTAATTLAALISNHPTADLTATESALLVDWLARLSDASAATSSTNTSSTDITTTRSTP